MAEKIVLVEKHSNLEDLGIWGHLKLELLEGHSSGEENL